MKKKSSYALRYLSFGILLLGFCISSSTFASQTPVPFQITFPNDSSSDSDRIINDTSALIGGYLIAGANAGGAVSVDVHIGTSPQSMNVSAQAVFANPAIQPNASYPFTLSFGGLIPGTTYYFYATEIMSGESFPVQQFTTTGNPPSNVLPPPSNSTLSGAFNISFPSSEQVITETSVTLSGSIVALSRVSINLGIIYGTSPSLMLQSGNVYSNPSLASGASDTFTYTMSNLSPGTGYYFQFRDLARNTSSELLYVKTKGGDGTGDTVHYGATVITDGSSVPTSFDSGIVVEDPYEDIGLVPCATSTNSTMCGFQDFLKLIGNVIDYTLILLVPATAAVCVYAGVSFIISRGDPTKLKAAKDRLVRVLIAMAVIMLAWAVVAGIYKSLIPEDQLDEYILLDVLNNEGN